MARHRQSDQRCLVDKVGGGEGGIERENGYESNCRREGLEFREGLAGPTVVVLWYENRWSWW